MDKRYLFIRVIRDTSDVEDAADKCNTLLNKELKQRAVDFAYWLVYDNDIFEKFVRNKISAEELYDIFMKELIK